MSSLFGEMSQIQLFCLNEGYAINAEHVGSLIQFSLEMV